MRITAVFFALVVIATAHAQRSYHGHISMNREALLSAAVSPEHRKLLLYVFDKLDKARFDLTLADTGKFTQTFDDGTPQNKSVATGSWRQDGDSIILTPSDDKPFTITVEGGKLSSPFMGSKSYTVRYSRA